jgi:hypothetical protein
MCKVIIVTCQSVLQGAGQGLGFQIIEVVFSAPPVGEVFRALALFLGLGNQRRVNSGVCGIDAEEFQQGGINGIPIIDEGG